MRRILGMVVILASIGPGSPACSAKQVAHRADPPLVPACAAREGPNSRPFNKTRPEVLVGYYELTMVSTWEEAAGRWSRGDLEIWRTPGGMVQGASDIDLDSLKVPGMVIVGDSLLWWLGSGDIASRDTLSPGLHYYFSGVGVDGGFLLAPESRLFQDVAVESYLEVDSVSDTGFWGRWDSEQFGITLYDKEGRVLPNPNGTFCAREGRTDDRLDEVGDGTAVDLEAIGLKDSRRGVSCAPDTHDARDHLARLLTDPGVAGWMDEMGLTEADAHSLVLVTDDQVCARLWNSSMERAPSDGFAVTFFQVRDRFIMTEYVLLGTKAYGGLTSVFNASLERLGGFLEQ